MSARRLVVAVMASASIGLAACGDADSEEAEPPVTSQPNEEEATEPAPTTTASEATASSVPATAPTPIDERVIAPGAPAVVLLTPGSGGGSRPLLEWEPVDNAAYYSVVVYDPEGNAYWGTLIDEPSTYVGGPVQLEEDSPGPRVVEGMAWSVVARDADMFPLAISGVRPLAP